MLVPITPSVDLVLMDETGSTGAVSFHLPLGTTVATAVSAANALAAVVLPVSGCVLVRRRIVYKYKEQPVPSADVGASIVSRGVFFFDCGTDSPNAVIDIPGIRDEVFITTGAGAGIVIDPTLPSVSDYISAIVDNGASNPFADDVVGFIEAYLQSRV